MIKLAFRLIQIKHIVVFVEIYAICPYNSVLRSSNDSYVCYLWPQVHVTRHIDRTQIVFYFYIFIIIENARNRG